MFMVGLVMPKFWSSSPHPPNAQSAWTVEFTHGKATPDSTMGVSNRVRCVR